MHKHCAAKMFSVAFFDIVENRNNLDIILKFE